jgi:saccharopepsin
MAITSNKGLSSDIDGILGLGASSTSGPSFMDNLFSAGKIDDAMVSFNLGFYNKNSKLTIPSTVTFGGYNDDLFDGNLTWFPLKTNNWWALDMRQIKYGNLTIG